MSGGRHTSSSAWCCLSEAAKTGSGAEDQSINCQVWRRTAYLCVTYRCLVNRLQLHPEN